jgi:hypothetical protein
VGVQLRDPHGLGQENTGHVILVSGAA